MTLILRCTSMDKKNKNKRVETGVLTRVRCQCGGRIVGVDEGAPIVLYRLTMRAVPTVHFTRTTGITGTVDV
jgi:hypothetical protein